MKTRILLALALTCALVSAQLSRLPGVKAPCTATRTANCTVQVDSTGAANFPGPVSVGKAVLDPVTGLNNVQPALLPKWRLALAKVRDGVADAKILCIGDSRTAGFGGTNSPSPYNSTPVNQSLDSWPRRLATLLSVYIPSAPGLAVPTCALCVTSPDARWVYGTGWTLYGYGFGGGIGTDGSAAYGTGSPTGNLVFTPGAVGTYDSFRIYYGTHPTAYGTLTVTASGGTPVVINTHIAQSTTSSVALAASAAITNTVTISCSGTCRVDGIEPFLSTTATVRVGNAGVAASNTFHWSYNGFASSLWAINAYAPDLAIIALGTNDGTGSLSVAVVTANLTTIITAARLSGDVILVSPPVSGTNPTGANEILYRPAMKALAASLGVAFLDMQEQWGGVYQPLMMDPGVATLVHFNNLGSWDFAGAVKEFLLRVR